MNPREMSEQDKLIEKLHNQGMPNSQILRLVLREIGETESNRILSSIVEYFEEE